MLKKILILTSLLISANVFADYCDPTLWNMPIRYTEILADKVQCAYSASSLKPMGYAIYSLPGKYIPLKGKWINTGNTYKCEQEYPIDNQHGWEQCNFKEVK